MTKKKENQVNPEHNDNECPECCFKGDGKFPNGYVIEGNGSSKHCPCCGYWSNQE